MPYGNHDSGQPDDLYPYVDLRGRQDDDAAPDDDGEGDDPGEPTVTRKRRPAAATPKTAKTKTTTRQPRGRTRKGAELAIGGLIFMTLTGFAVYAVAHEVLGWPRDMALVLAGLSAGLCPLLGQALLHARRRLAKWIAPGKTTSRARP
ncbi:hypothetical protein [Nonomuraea sp. NPDC052265]|uniref:hypothetical protein n=1 Tax=Nonomuraea sp. NPDC052265 TaxID=3364374 RepID=UPI0037C57C6F